MKPSSIGLPVPRVEVKVMDDSGRSLSPHETGELLFKGPNIMKGYYNHAQETNEIIRDGWLHTGDLGSVE